MDQADSSHDGYLNMEEFIKYMKQWKHSLSVDKDVLEAFEPLTIVTGIHTE